MLIHYYVSFYLDVGCLSFCVFFLEHVKFVYFPTYTIIIDLLVALPIRQYHLKSYGRKYILIYGKSTCMFRGDKTIFQSLISKILLKTKLQKNILYFLKLSKINI